MSGFTWPLTPPELRQTADGSLENTRYQDVYFSRSSGLAESRHVFISGNDLDRRFAGGNGFHLLEIGFGTGLNFLATWRHFLATAPSGARLHYVAVEKHPLSPTQLTDLLAQHAEIAEEVAMLARAWPDRIPGFHRRHFAGGRISLTLLFGDVTETLPELEGHFDAVYLDGFAPARNPAMWSQTVFNELARLMNPGGTLATYTSASSVRDGLHSAGFETERRAGFARKRHMLVGRLPGEKRTNRPTTSPTVAVIGAGIAGIATAAALTRRGIPVQLFDRAERPASGGSGNPAGIIAPVLSRDWNTLSQLTGPAIGYLHAELASLQDDGKAVDAHLAGTMRLARQARHAERQAGIAVTLQPPAEFAQWLDAAEIQALSGLTSHQPGWFYPGGGWLSPRSLIAAWLDDPRIDGHWATHITKLERDREGRWLGYDQAGRQRFDVDQVVLATAEATEQLLPSIAGLIEPCRGQISRVPLERLTNPVRLPACPVSREGYVLEPIDGQLVFGASFKPGDSSLAPRVEEHEENRQRLLGIDPALAEALPPVETWDARVALRATTPDRLPLVGPAPESDSTGSTLAGLYLSIGHGARGLTWGPLLGEALVGMMLDEPALLPRTVQQQIAPVRFALRRHRRGS